MPGLLLFLVEYNRSCLAQQKNFRSSRVTTDNFSRRQFLKLGGIGVVGAVSFPAMANTTQERLLYVGTYTSGKSEGIYMYGLNETTGELNLKSSVKSDNPSFVVVNPGRYLYAVNEVLISTGNQPAASVLLRSTSFRLG
jgi:hypothetical protein